MYTSNTKLNICILGAAPDTQNHGVSALLSSTLSGLHRHLPHACFTVLDHQKGYRKISARNSTEPEYLSSGAYNTRRFYLRESIWNMWVSSHLGGAGSRPLRAISDADVVLDISGGDSFTDLYGARRFDAITLPKLIALKCGRPLILLPQTFGPYSQTNSNAKATSIIKNAYAVWARDQNSHDLLRSMLGTHFDPDKHRKGVDLAFLLESIPANDLLPNNLAKLFHVSPSDGPIGINISGLLYNRSDSAKTQFSLLSNYRELIHALIKQLLEQTDRLILLVPHVHTSSGNFECDADANLAIVEHFSQHPDHSRLYLLPPTLDHQQTKWLISQCAWFCGTRMHSTVAGLSTGVPTTAIAYSDKTRTVFETMGQGPSVVDPRQDSIASMLKTLSQHYEARDTMRASLKSSTAAIVQKAKEQMAVLAEMCIQASCQRHR